MLYPLHKLELLATRFFPPSFTGIENTRAIQEIAKHQNLRYKFPFNEYSFPTDITLITLTEGKESLLMKVKEKPL